MVLQSLFQVFKNWLKPTSAPTAYVWGQSLVALCPLLMKIIGNPWTKLVKQYHFMVIFLTVSVTAHMTQFWTANKGGALPF